jgi:hypothetical protein
MAEMKTRLLRFSLRTLLLLEKWDQDVKAYDAVYEHILKMADALTDGIVKQFSEKFGDKI